jgi:glycosyltransferase involved in cell wall biosynthesis
LYTTSNIGDLKFFYKNAMALIHPSLSEGFGLPLIEAANFNCPIIGSNIPVFKELLNNQYISFDPNNVKEMTNTITSFYKKPKKFNYKEVLKRFSFCQMAKITLEIYKKY